MVDDAADGETGLTLALSRPYDVAIIDRMLPELDGLSIVAALRVAAHDVCVVLPVDCPSMTAAGLRALADACSDAAVPEGGGRTLDPAAIR